MRTVDFAVGVQTSLYPMTTQGIRRIGLKKNANGTELVCNLPGTLVMHPAMLALLLAEARGAGFNMVISCVLQNRHQMVDQIALNDNMCAYGVLQLTRVVKTRTLDHSTVGSQTLKMRTKQILMMKYEQEIPTFLFKSEELC